MPHAPVVIASDDELSAGGWPGDGSPSSPYLIEGLLIETNGTGISVSDTSLHLKVRDCVIVVAGQDTGAGLALVNAQNVLVEGLRVDGGLDGVVLRRARQCTVRGLVANGSTYGVRIVSSQGVSLSDITAVGCGNGVCSLRAVPTVCSRTRRSGTAPLQGSMCTRHVGWKWSGVR